MDHNRMHGVNLKNSRLSRVILRLHSTKLFSLRTLKSDLIIVDCEVTILTRYFDEVSSIDVKVIEFIFKMFLNTNLS